jgi:predicted lipid-binding transport protein (Tim44 family)
MPLTALIMVAIVLGAIGLAIAINVWDAGREGRERRRQRREQEAADAAEAGEPSWLDVAVERAAELYVAVHDAWDRADLVALERLLAPPLFAAWRCRLAELDERGWYHRMEQVELQSVDWLDFAERGDRVTVSISARLLDYHVHADGSLFTRVVEVDGRAAGYTFLRGRVYTFDDGVRIQAADFPVPDVVRRTEVWRLACDAHGRGWVVASIEDGAYGEEQLAAWHDDDDAASPESAILHYGRGVRIALADGAIVDDRWAAAPLEAAVRRAVTAWLAGTADDADDLREVAAPAAARAMLHPEDPSGRRLQRIREPRIRELAVTAVDRAAAPPQATVELIVSGRRHVVDRETGAVAGSERPVTSFHRWTLERCGPAERPWLVVAADTAR